MMDTSISRRVREAAGTAHGDFLRDVLAGLRAPAKHIPCKYFYDAEGSRLFDRICKLPEYYQTRTEMALLHRHAPEMAALMGSHVELIEFGAGSLDKVRLLLSALNEPYSYVPVDISSDYLIERVAELAVDYPAVRLSPLTADFTGDMHLSPSPPGTHRAGFFPGSTIGNFEPEEAVFLLRNIAGLLQGGGLLIGVDLVKDPAILHAAYNDAQGVTAAFNRNLLVRANRELGSNFAPHRFAHYAPYNPHRARIEMYLVSLAMQEVRIGPRIVTFGQGEPIHTESSHKFTLEGFAALAAHAGFRAAKSWNDPAESFAIFWLEPDERIAIGSRALR